MQRKILFTILLLFVFSCIFTLTEKELANLSKKAKNGDVIAQYNLGVMYSNGQGVIQDYRQAYKWFLIVCDYGDSDLFKDASQRRNLADKKLTLLKKNQAKKEAKEIQQKINNKKK